MEGQLDLSLSTLLTNTPCTFVMNLRVNVFIILVLTSLKVSRMLVNGKLIPSDYLLYSVSLFYMCTCKVLTVSVKQTIARAIGSWKVQGSYSICGRRACGEYVQTTPLGACAHIAKSKSKVRPKKKFAWHAKAASAITCLWHRAPALRFPLIAER